MKVTTQSARPCILHAVRPTNLRTECIAHGSIIRADIDIWDVLTL